MEDRIDMNGGIDISYEDVLKAYQKKSSELLTQLVTTEAKLIASENLVLELRNKIIELENSSQKVTTKTTRSKKTAVSVVDYNNKYLIWQMFSNQKDQVLLYQFPLRVI